MNGEQSGGGDVMSNVVSIEAQLAATLAEAAEEVAHMEFFDQEQRAEIYTILQAMRADSQVHQEVVGWVSDVTGEVSDV